MTLHRSSLSPLSVLVAVLLAATPSVAQRILHSQLVATASGTVLGLFEVEGGVASLVPTGLPSNNFPSLSPDGRFVTLSSPDPAFPNEASDDLWEYDRATGITRKIIDNDTIEENGSIFFSAPVFSARSPDNQLVAVATQLGAVPSGGGLPRQLTVHRASDGFLEGLAEIGQGGALDLTRGEFLGLDWTPDGALVAAPAYVDIFSNTGRPTAAIGIVLYGFNPGTLDWDRAGVLTIPQVFDLPGTIVQVNHAFPVFSPDGQQIAFFSITFPDPLLLNPVTVRLHRANASGGSPVTLLEFVPGLYPTGLSWSADGSELFFSIATQASSGSVFSPLGLPETSVLRRISAAGGTPQPIPGAPFGAFPSAVPVPEPALPIAVALGAVLIALRPRDRVRVRIAGRSRHDR
jgi:hypothetical protein